MLSGASRTCREEAGVTASLPIPVLPAVDGRCSGVAERSASLRERLRASRRFTEALCAPLHPEDCVLQSMPDASPPKWHLAHTTWFFETFVLAPHRPGYRPYREHWDYLFNSYYESVGPRHPRPARGLLTRPTIDEVYAYRQAVDEQVDAFFVSGDAASHDVLDLVELGIAHEQQHQELLLTDLQHGLSCNPLLPSYRDGQPARGLGCAPAGFPARFIECEGGLCRVGHDAAALDAGFAFDNEGPAHRVYLEPFALAARPVTAGEYADFIADGGYRRPELWLSDGWATVRSEGWQAPLYWEQRDSVWLRFSLYGLIEVDAAAPVCHVSFFEADAFARWAGLRLPTEAEWELVARDLPRDGQFIEHGALVPLCPDPAQRGLFGGTWTWTSSPYASYPGFEPPPGAIGEYNAKFMVNQMVLRGGSCFSPASHLRATYRNFFPPQARWQVSGIRLARTS
jgi:ergothioneine biosynthesis protein EgtB